MHRMNLKAVMVFLPSVGRRSLVCINPNAILGSPCVAGCSRTSKLGCAGDISNFKLRVLVVHGLADVKSEKFNAHRTILFSHLYMAFDCVAKLLDRVIAFRIGA